VWTQGATDLLILASTSRVRRTLLEAAGIRVQCEASGVDERAFAASDPVELSRTLALAKARSVASRFPGRLVLGADQVGFDPARPEAHFGKPADRGAHVAMLRGMRGRAHVLVTGFAFVCDGDEEVGDERTVLHVRSDVVDAEIEAYADSGEGRGSAGGYEAERGGAFLFDRIDGDWFNVLGLPLLRVFDGLRRRGWRWRT
jgi:septum formation protein